jgi:hypothetical protein
MPTVATLPLQVTFVVIMGGVLLIGIEFFMIAFRVGDQSEGQALCSDIFDAVMQFSAILAAITAFVGSIWERQAQRCIWARGQSFIYVHHSQSCRRFPPALHFLLSLYQWTPAGSPAVVFCLRWDLASFPAPLACISHFPAHFCFPTHLRRSGGAFRRILVADFGPFEPLRNVLCSCNPLGLAADFATAAFLYLIHRVIVYTWRLIQTLYAQPVFSW